VKKVALILTLALISLNLIAEAPAPKSAIVVDAYVDGNAITKSAAIGDILVVNVAHLNTLLTAQNNIKQVRLFIDCIEIEGSVPVGC